MAQINSKSADGFQKERKSQLATLRHSCGSNGVDMHTSAEIPHLYFANDTIELNKHHWCQHIDTIGIVIWIVAIYRMLHMWVYAHIMVADYVEIIRSPIVYICIYCWCGFKHVKVAENNENL